MLGDGPVESEAMFWPTVMSCSSLTHTPLLPSHKTMEILITTYYLISRFKPIQTTN